MPPARASLWSDYRASGGQRLGGLTLVDGIDTTRVDGQDLTELEVPKPRWTALGGDLRQVIRLDWPTGEVTERRISRVNTEDGAPTVTLSLLPPLDDLASGGPILRTVAGRIATRVAGELTVTQVLTTYVLPHSAAIRLGLVLGTIEKNSVVPFDLDAPTCAALIRDVFDKAKLEIELVRTSDTVWTLNGRAKRGSTASTLRVRSARNQQQLALGVDDSAFATVVVPLGEADPATGDRATIATALWAVAGITSGWVQLRDPADVTRSPILVDTQWLNAWVVDRFGYAQKIINARTTDGAVQVASTTGLSVGSLVRIAADSAGTPLAEVYDATAVGAKRRVVPLPLDAVRGEANELRNPRFLSGLDQWAAVNPTTPPAFAEVMRGEMGVMRTGQASAARAASTGTGTPFGIKNLPANAFVRQHAEIKVGGALLALSADVIPDASGAFTLPLSAGLPGSYVDDTPFTLIRRETRTLTLDGAQSPLTNFLVFRSTNTDNMFPANAGSLDSTSAVYSVPGNVTQFAAFGYVDTPGTGRVRLEVASNIGRSGVTWASIGADVYQFTDFVLAFTVGDATGTATYSSAGAAPIVGTRIRYFSSNTNFVTLKVTAVSAVLSVATEDGTPIVPWSGLGLWEGCNVLLADGSTWTYTAIRETRTVRCNGAVSAAATSLPCKAQANLATRNWVATDTITLIRTLTGAFDITSVGSVTTLTFYDEELAQTIATGYELAVTFAAATSTMDDLASGDWSGLGVTFQNGGSGVWTLVSIVGTTATFQRGTALPNDPLEVGTASATWVKPDTYALTGTASWGTNGRVTLTLASAIPTGRSYAKGLPVTANWISSGLRLHAAVAAAATTVELFGNDAFYATSDPTASLRGALYRLVTSGPTIPIPGNTLYAAGTVQADGSGNASVTLTAANPNAIALNDAVTITTPDMLRPSDDRLGSLVRLMSPVAGAFVPTSSTPGITPIGRVPITVPDGTTVPVTALVTFSLSAGAYPLGQQPAVAIVDDAGTILKSGRLADTTAIATQTPTLARIIVQTVLTASKTISVRLYGGTNDIALVTAALDAMLCVTDRDDVPFVIGSWSNRLAIRGAEELAVRRDVAVNVELDIATLRRWSDAPASVPVVVGQLVELPAYGLTRRVLSVRRSVIDPERIRVEIGVPTDDLSTQVGSA